MKHMKHIKPFAINENEYSEVLLPVIKELENTPEGKDVLSISSYSKGSGDTLHFPVNSTLGTKKPTYLYITPSSARPIWAIVRQIGITHESIDDGIGITATLRALWARLAISNLGKPFNTGKFAKWLKDDSCPLHGKESSLHQIKEYLIIKLNEDEQEKSKKLPLWSHIPSVEDLNSLKETKDTYEGLHFHFVGIRRKEGTIDYGARKLELTNATFSRRGDHFTFYPKSLRIEDYRHIIMRNVKMETLDDWKKAITRFINYAAAVQLNDVMKDKMEDSYGVTGPYNQNKIAKYRRWEDLPQVLNNPDLWLNPYTHQVLMWIIKNPRKMLEDQLNKNVILNYGLIIDNLVSYFYLDPKFVEKLDQEKIKKFTRASNILRRK